MLQILDSQRYQIFTSLRFTHIKFTHLQLPQCTLTVETPLGVNILSTVSGLPLDSDMTGTHGLDPSRAITDCRRLG